ncbi:MULTISPECIES: gamma subclass chorismate mutase AroQ [Stenotrophomonas]|uniref:gamma subclass chorismate mutase AroQ n=1 Tax=Stenotrophomonas TaxID=40323 RepID=UPI0015FA185E|nr:gamma subclass chorismate mutase AroQ [Stenotrophomonas lacuserhaii]
MPVLDCCRAVLLATLLPAAVQATPMDRFVAVAAERNAIAHQVAAFKYPAARPVEDPVREAQVLQDKRVRATQLGLDAEAVVHFYRQLIEANKLIQHVAFHRYAAGEVPAPAPSLEELRGMIDVADEKLLALWPGIAPQRGRPGCTKTVAEAVDHRMQEAVGHVALVRAMIDLCRPEAGGTR